MCAILGGTNKQWDYSAGIESMKHRGPDGIRIRQYKYATMAFARLAIRDLSDRAMQPMETEDHNIIVCFNGEIYNADYLKNKLDKKYRFRTCSDTEVLLYAYKEYGIRFIDYVEGMFAISVLDLNHHRLVLYRDRIGIKPLYYYKSLSGFAFSSELKGVLNTVDDKFEVDETALYDSITYGYVPVPKTGYKNIFQLEAASFLIYDLDSERIISKKRYWDCIVTSSKETIATEDKEYFYEGFKDRVHKTVKEQMVSDVEVGTLLSGGVDSSIITYEAHRYDDSIKAFNIGFDVSDEKYKVFDESPYALRFAMDIGCKCISERYNEYDAKKTIDEMYDWYDEPYYFNSCLPTYNICRVARKNKVKVLLSGDGGDELFCGYKRYKNVHDNLLKHRLRNHNSLISDFYYRLFYSRGILRRLGEYILDEFEYSSLSMDYVSGPRKRERMKTLGYFIPRDYDDFWYFRQFDRTDMPLISRMQYIDFNTYLPDACLKKIDRASMQCGVEVRVPLCSTELVEFAFETPESIIYEEEQLKSIMKHAYSGIIPDYVLNKKKKGFSMPPYYDEYLARGNMEYRFRLLEGWIARAV